MIYINISKIWTNFRFFIQSFSKKFVSSHIFDACLGSLQISLHSQEINVSFFWYLTTPTTQICLQILQTLDDPFWNAIF